MAVGFGELKLFSEAPSGAGAEIASFLGVTVGQARLKRFPDTEVSFQIDENIRGTDIFVIQPTCANGPTSVDQHIMELLIMIDAFRRPRRRGYGGAPVLTDTRGRIARTSRGCRFRRSSWRTC
jgi:ribose-phosphate pyrophosphokinase